MQGRKWVVRRNGHRGVDEEATAVLSDGDGEGSAWHK